jgi:calcineurin-like phosphoesterase family protein
MATYFTSDTHFNHKNIIDYSDRPFRTLDGHPDVPAMNRALIANWNERVSEQDVVYHLGDFGMGPWKEWASFRKKLNGKIILVKGNHDKKVESWLLPGDEVHPFLFIDGIFMVHVPPAYEESRERYSHDMPTQHPVPEGTRVVLCGHVHEKWETTLYKNIPVINVGVDVRGLKPVTLTELQVTSDKSWS